jgi:hypothetical protein
MPALDVSRYRLDPPEKVNRALQLHIPCFVTCHILCFVVPHASAHVDGCC